MNDWSKVQNGPGKTFVLLKNLMERGEDELNEPQPQGTLEARGLLAKMVYHPPEAREGSDVGTLSHYDEENTAVMEGCVMDTERHTKRECCVLLVYGANVKDKYSLVLERVDGVMTFKRAGICKADNFGDLKGFSATDIKIV